MCQQMINKYLKTISNFFIRVTNSQCNYYEYDLAFTYPYPESLRWIVDIIVCSIQIQLDFLYENLVDFHYVG